MLPLTDVSNAAHEAAAGKHRMRVQWDAAAAGWNKHGPSIRAWLRGPTDAMFAMARVTPGLAVLDVAAGAGDQTLEIADRVGPQGSVLATDLSARILAYVLSNAQQAGFGNVLIQHADAENLPLGTDLFDAAVCRLGLMFLPNPAAGLAEIRRVLKPGAFFCGMVFAELDLNPCLRIAMATALRHAGATPRDPDLPGGLFSLGKPGRIDDLMQQGGFRAVATTRMEAPFRLPTTADYVRFLQDAAGPVREVLSPLPDSARDAAWANIAAELNIFQTADGWIGPNNLLLSVGRK